MTLGHI